MPYSHIELLIFDSGDPTVAMPREAVVVTLPVEMTLIPVTGPLLTALTSGEPDDDDRIRPGWILKMRVCRLVRNLSAGRQVLYVAGETFGSIGCQEAIGWRDGQQVYAPTGTCDLETDRDGGYHVMRRGDGAINVGLRQMGVMATAGHDERDEAGLARHRFTDDWLGH